MTVQPRLLLGAAACSRRAGALSVLPSHTLAAYAASNNVVVFDSVSHKVHAILPLHKAAVTAVELKASQNGEAFLFAASGDGAVAAARICKDEILETTGWAAHENQPCAALCACDVGGMTLITAGMEGEVRVWRYGSDFSSWSLAAETGVSSTGEVLLECVAMQQVGEKAAVVAVGGTDRRVCLFYASLGDKPVLSQVASLDGHRDWIRGLSFSAPESTGTFRLASASKDGTARVWRVERAGTDCHDEFDVHTARVKAQLGHSKYYFIAEALLDEHTAAVHSVEFGGDGEASSGSHLLTSSMDCSVALWRKGDEHWESAARFGLMGGSSAHALGFFGASFARERCDEVLGHNFAGALHCWRTVDVDEDRSVEFLARSAPGGHFGAVMDLAWEPRGRYLLTCSVDKTSRIFTEVEEKGERRFVEWARPQVHGHAMFAAAFCNESGRKYVSGGEERMLRMFEAPSSFGLPGETGLPPNVSTEASSAVVPELGLSNKATFGRNELRMPTEDDVANGARTPTDDPDLSVNSFGAVISGSILPLEEDLKQNRLWPETAKLYGHGNEISCVTADPKNAVVASACRAQAAKDATIILWDTTNGVECGRLSQHDLTVNQMRFASHGNALVAVSRDRSVSVFEKRDNGNRFSFTKIAHRKAAHARLIYSCTWLLDNRFIATGGRDKCLKLFTSGLRGQADGLVEVFKQKFSSGVSALDAIDYDEQQRQAVLAAGFEGGDILLFRIQELDNGNISMSPLFSSSRETRCGARINALRWRPRSCVKEQLAMTELLHLAVASEDQSVRVLEFDLNLESPH